MDAQMLSVPSVSMQQFIDEELLRVPLWMNQLQARLRNNLPSHTSPAQRSAAVDAMAAAQGAQGRLIQAMAQQLRRQLLPTTASSPSEQGAAGITEPCGGKPGTTLGLVEDEVVAVDVVIARAVEQINSATEHELRELQTFTAALAGDMDFTRDHNPFSPWVIVRALWAASQELSHKRALRVAYMSLAAAPLAQCLRQAYAAASSRLEAQGVQPAAYRTLVLPGGGRLSRRTEITFSPELQKVLAVMPHQAAEPATPAASHHDNPAIADRPPQPADPQAMELVRRLFAAMAQDRRIPADVQALLARLVSPALRLARCDPGLMDRDRHALWGFVNQLVFAAEVTPDPSDPRRRQLLGAIQAAIDQINAHDRPEPALFAAARDQVRGLLSWRLQQRQQATASTCGALLELEHDLTSGRSPGEGAPQALDSQQLDTVPAALLDRDDITRDTEAEAQQWLHGLAVGDWLRMFLHGQWLRAQLLWVGPARQVWLFGDAASDATWAVRRGALLMMQDAALIHRLQMRSIVGSAAARVFAHARQGEKTLAA